jgi:hypothetical protein
MRHHLSSGWPSCHKRFLHVKDAPNGASRMLGFDVVVTRRKNPHAVALGRKGGKKGGPKGGKARWEGVSPEERREIARKAALARWKRKKAPGA